MEGGESCYNIKPPSSTPPPPPNQLRCLIARSASRSERSGNTKVVGSNPDLTVSNPGQVKPMTLQLILVAPIVQHSALLGQGLVGSV